MQTCLQLADRKQFIKVDLAVLVNVIIDELHGFLIDTNDTISNEIVENVAYTLHITINNVQKTADSKHFCKILCTFVP